MDRDRRSRRGTLALVAGAVTVGCTTVLRGGPSDRLPILVSLSVLNDTDDAHEYELRVRYAADAGRSPATVYRSGRTVPARGEIDVEGDWPAEPGRYAVGVSVDDGEWHTRDLTDRFSQDERICYAQAVFIGDGGAAPTFWTNVNAPRPEP